MCIRDRRDGGGEVKVREAGGADERRRTRGQVDWRALERRRRRAAVGKDVVDHERRTSHVARLRRQTSPRLVGHAGVNVADGRVVADARRAVRRYVDVRTTTSGHHVRRVTGRRSHRHVYCVSDNRRNCIAGSCRNTAEKGESR